MLAIPENISLEMAQQFLNAAAVQLSLRDDEQSKRRRVLECDEALRQFEHENIYHFGPVVRASTYKTPHRFQEIQGWHSSGDPRRPVCMRGSLSTMIYLYSNSSSTARNGYCRALFARCLRMSKATILYQEDLNEFYRQLSHKIFLKHRPNQYHDRYAISGVYLIGGRQVLLNREQLNYLRKLSGLIRKTHKLDDELSP